MDFERSDFDETEVSESLHIDQLAYKDPRRSYNSEGISHRGIQKPISIFPSLSE